MSQLEAWGQQQGNASGGKALTKVRRSNENKYKLYFFQLHNILLSPVRHAGMCSSPPRPVVTLVYMLSNEVVDGAEVLETVNTDAS